MKRLGKKKIISLIMVLSMVITTIFSLQISNVDASTNTEKAKELVSKMTLEEKIGQKLMLSFRSGWTMEDGTKVSSVQNINDEIYKIIGEYDIGSVILFAANFNADATVNVELTDGLQRAAMDKDLGKNNIPLLIAADQEGGIVYRLTGGTALPGNMALGATGDTVNAIKAGEIIGSELSAVGVNTNFAPDADVNNNPNNPVIGLRSFSSNPQLAAEFTSAYIEGVQSKNVATTAKHFPGHGNVATDSHTGLPSINSTKEELYQTELVPFQAAIESGTDMIMTAHIQFPNIVTEELYSSIKDEFMSPPATLSREILTDLLRNELNYDGVIVTDSMTMAGVASYFDVNERNLLAVKAGVDILDIPFTDISSLADMKTKLIPLINAFVDAYTKEDGYNGITLSVDELDKSVERILTCKYNRNVMDLVNDTTTLAEKKAIASSVVGSVENRETERLISANAVTVVKNENDVLPLKLTNDSRVVFASTYSRNNNRFVLAWERAKQAGIIPEGADYKILQHYNWTGLNDNVNSAINSDGTNFVGTNKDVLDWGTVLVHASEISSAGGIDGYLVACPQLFTNYCKQNGKQTVVISLNHPYDVQAFPDADAILAVYGTTSAGLDITESFGGGTVGATAAFSPNLTAGTEVVLGTFGASGKLPVDIPKYVPGSKVYSTDENVYELGFGIEYEALAKEPDKTALVDVIDQVKGLKEAEFTAESWAAAVNELNELQVALQTAENINLTHKLAQTIVDETKNNLQEKYAAVLDVLVINKIDQTALQIAVDTANTLKAQGALDNVVPAVAAEFETALANAEAVLADISANQATIDSAFYRLANAIHMLEFVKGDKSALEALINEAEKYEEENYTTDSWTAFKEALDAARDVMNDENALESDVNEALNNLTEAIGNLVLRADKTRLQEAYDMVNGLDKSLYTENSVAGLVDPMANAKAVLDDPDATQAEVDAAYEALIRAYLDLRLIPNKDLLQGLINKAETLNATNYSAKTWSVMMEALDEAKAALDDPKATQAEVDNAKEVLAKAMAGLEVNNPVKAGDTTASVATGDNGLIGIFASLSVLSFAGLSLLRKKEN